MGVAELSYRDAVIRGIAQEMDRDNRVVFLGEDIGKAGGVFKSTVGLYEKFGPLRVRDTPISEQAILGAAMGAAMTGLRPIAEIMFSDFLPTAADAIHALAVQVTVGGEGFNGLTATSAGVTIAGGVLSDVTPPLIEGNVKLGHVVSVNVGETAPAKDAAPHVQWLLEGNPIPNAVQPTYAIGAGDVYKRLSVAVTYAPQGYEPLTAQSRELVVAVGDFEPGHPAISARSCSAVAGAIRCGPLSHASDRSFSRRS